MSYLGKSPTGTGIRSRYYYTATGGETSISGADDSGAILTFTDGAYVDVYLNGVLLVAGTDYNTSTANTISSLAALAGSDIVEVLVYDIFTVADTVKASSGGTFNGTVTATAFVGDGSALTGVEAFPSGTLMLFQQTAAPTGWTKQTTHNDKALRVVSGSAGSGGSVAFTTALGTPAVSGSVSLSGNISDTTLSTAQMPSHSHSYNRFAGSNSQGNTNDNQDGTRFRTLNTGNTGGGGSHNHGHNLAGSLSSATTTINVNYVDLIIAAKD